MEPFEPPKYLEKLIAAVNDGAKSAQLGALAFTAIGIFLLATAFSATDEDLLLNRALTISQLGGTAVPVVFAFGLAPAVFVAAHFYTLIRYDMLADSLQRFREDLIVLVPEALDRDRCRKLLANVEFINAIVMPKGSRASSWMFSWTVSVLLAGFPVVVLLSVQLQSLRLQSYLVNWTHHICIAADLVLLIWFFGRLRGDDTWHFWKAPMQRKVSLCWMAAVVLAVDLLWLEVPGPDAETVRTDILFYARYYDDASEEEALLDRLARVLLALPVQPIDMVLCAHAHVGCRFLTVAHRNLVAKILDATTFVALRAGADADEKHLASFEVASLRGRRLRFADLTASELFAADLTGADLRLAVLSGTKLKKGVLQGAQLQGAYLSEAQLQGAFLQGAQLQGAYLSKAQLQGADLQEAQLQRAFLRLAQLQGADLQGAQLQGADLQGAQLQGADLRGAQLQGADLQGAQLQGADLRGAQLQGADLQRAQLQGADLRGAALWNISADRTQLGLADLRRANFNEVSAEDLLAQLPAETPEDAKQQLRERLVPKAGAQALPRDISTEAGKILVTNRDDPTWQNLDRTAQLTTEPADIDSALAELLADTVAPTSPSVAEIVARRVIFPGSDQDKQRPLIKLLGCRLLAQADAKRVTLRAEKIDQLREATGPCDPASQQ